MSAHDGPRAAPTDHAAQVRADLYLQLRQLNLTDGAENLYRYLDSTGSSSPHEQVSKPASIYALLQLYSPVGYITQGGGLDPAADGFILDAIDYLPESLRDHVALRLWRLLRKFGDFTRCLRAAKRIPGERFEYALNSWLGETAAKAASRGDLNILRSLEAEFLSKFAIFSSLVSADTLLGRACANGHAEAAKYLFTKAPETAFVANHIGDTPWHASARNGHLSVLATLYRELVGSSALKAMWHPGADKNRLSDAENLTKENEETGKSEVGGQNGMPGLDTVSIETASQQDLSTRVGESMFADSVREIRTPSGQTLLHLACTYGHVLVVEFLLSKNADPIATCHAGVSCLRAALANDHFRICMRLLREPTVHATLNKLDDKGKSLISIASSCMGRGAVHLLLGVGADCVPLNQDGSTPITEAITHGKLDNLSALLSSDGFRNSSLGITYYPGGQVFESTALHLAVECDSVPALKLLFEHGADPTTREGSLEQLQPLHVACSLGRADAVLPLIGNPVRKLCLDDRTRDNRSGSTAFHIACSAGPDVEQLSENGPIAPGPKSPAPVIQYGPYEAIINYLAYADWWLEDGRGRLFIHLAAFAGHANRLRYLFTFFEDDEEAIVRLFHARDNAGQTALEIALERKHISVIEVFVEQMPNIQIESLWQSREKSLGWLTEVQEGHDLISILLYRQMNSQDRRASGPPMDALGWATWSCSPKLVWGLLQNSTPGPALEFSIQEAMDATRQAMKKLESSAGGGHLREAYKARGIADRRNTGVNDRKDTDARGKAADADPSRIELQKTYRGYKDILDILHNPPATARSIRRNLKEQGPPSDVERVPARFDKYKVQLLDCRQDSLLRSSLSVEEALYVNGPIDIMKKRSKRTRELHKEFGPQEQTEVEGAENCPAVESDPAPNVMWIHLPANNMQWHEDVCLMVNSELKSQEDEENFQWLSSSWEEVVGRGGESDFMKPLCAARFDGDQPKCAAIYMPYVAPAWHWRLRENCSDDLLSHYLSQGCVIHGSRTLDEYFYHSCRMMNIEKMMEERNRDQVLSKSLLENVRKRNSWVLVNADQLWIWIPNKDVIITSATHRQDGEYDPIFTATFDALQKAIKANGKTPKNAFEMAEFIINSCTNLFHTKFAMNPTQFRQEWSPKAVVGRRWMGHPPDPVIERFFRTAIRPSGAVQKDILKPHELSQVCIKDVFKTATAKASAEETRLYKKFIEHQAAISSHSSARGGHNSLSPKDRIETAELFREIKDIRDELKMLRVIAETQRSIQEEFRDLVKTKPRTLAHKDVADELQEMDKAVEQIETSVSITLNLQQNATAIAQTDAAVYQGQIMLLFTAVTIVFLPMSFFTSLFAVQVSEFLKTPPWTFGVIFGASSLISTSLAAYAFYSDAVNTAVGHNWRGLTGHFNALFHARNEKDGTQGRCENGENEKDSYGYKASSQSSHNTTEKEVSNQSHPPLASPCQGSTVEKNLSSRASRLLLSLAGHRVSSAAAQWYTKLQEYWLFHTRPDTSLPDTGSNPAARPPNHVDVRYNRIQKSTPDMWLAQWPRAVRQWFTARWPQPTHGEGSHSPPASPSGISRGAAVFEMELLDDGSSQQGNRIGGRQV